jgi:hypothetical protein
MSALFGVTPPAVDPNSLDMALVDSSPEQERSVESSPEQERSAQKHPAASSWDPLPGFMAEVAAPFQKNIAEMKVEKQSGAELDQGKEEENIKGKVSSPELVFMDASVRCLCKMSGGKRVFATMEVGPQGYAVGVFPDGMRQVSNMPNVMLTVKAVIKPKAMKKQAMKAMKKQAMKAMKKPAIKAMNQKEAMKAMKAMKKPAKYVGGDADEGDEGDEGDEEALLEETQATKAMEKQAMKAMKKPAAATPARTYLHASVMPRTALSPILGKVRMTLATEKSYICGELCTPHLICELNHKQVGSQHTALVQQLFAEAIAEDLDRDSLKDRRLELLGLHKVGA